MKRLAKAGLDGPAITAAGVGLVFAVLFVRRRNGLANPLPDVRPFAERTFGTALGVLLVGLVGVGGVMFLITQQLQFAEEPPPVGRRRSP